MKPRHVPGRLMRTPRRKDVIGNDVMRAGYEPRRHQVLSAILSLSLEQWHGLNRLIAFYGDIVPCDIFAPPFRFA